MAFHASACIGFWRDATLYSKCLLVCILILSIFALISVEPIWLLLNTTKIMEVLFGMKPRDIRFQQLASGTDVAVGLSSVDIV